MIDWIVGSSILIAVIIALRYILRGKVSLRLQYLLWALVLLRLLVPGSFGSSSLSVMNVVPDNIAERSLSSGIPSDAYTLPANDTSELSASADPMQPIDGSLVADVTHSSTVSDVTGQNAHWDSIANAVWLSGVAAVGMWLFICNQRFAAQLRRSRGALDVGNYPLPVYITGAVETPCLFGLLHPAIYVTAEATESKAKLYHVIEHESTHYRHGDHFWSILRGVCLTLHWYNPLVWWAAVLSQRDAELACDETTINRIGKNERARYARTLIGMTCQKRTAMLLTATTMTGSKSSIKERIMLIAKKPKMAFSTLVAVALIAAVTVGCTFTGAKTESGNGAADAGLTLYDIGEFAAAIPNEHAEQLIVYAGDDLSSDTELLSLYERASVEAARADGYTDAGQGWLFSLIRYDRAQYERYLCGDGSGLSFFAQDDHWYYGYAFPTDVRYYRQGDNYMAEHAVWDTLHSQVGSAVRDDFITRNNLLTYSDAEARTEYTYVGEHQLLNYYPYYSVNGSRDEFYVLTLSQPARQGAGGIWCVERMTDSSGHVLLWFPDTGVPAVEYYAQLQTECDAGMKTELLAVEGAAIAFLQESGYFGSSIIDGSLEAVSGKVD